MLPRYHLESQVAHYPGILLDGEVGDFAKLQSDFIARDGELKFLDPFTADFIDAQKATKSAHGFAAYNDHFGDKLAPTSAQVAGNEALRGIASLLSQDIAAANEQRSWGQIAWLFDRIASHLDLPVRARDPPTKVSPHPGAACRDDEPL